MLVTPYSSVGRLEGTGGTYERTLSHAARCGVLVCWSSDSRAHACSLDLTLKIGGFPWPDDMAVTRARTGSAAGDVADTNLRSSRESDERQVMTMCQRF